MESVGESSYRHIQESMRLGEAHDIYYYTHSTMMKQTIPTIVDIRFKQALNNLQAGSSTFIISVDQGISDILFGARLPAQGVNGADYSAKAVAPGWLYALINRISVRYSGSPQYFWTGGQMLLENLREMPNPTTRDQLFQLGGLAMSGAVAGAGDFAGDSLYAYAYLNLPHDSPNGSLMKPNPFPSELLSQPIVITLELNPIQYIFSSNVAGGALTGAPTSLVEAWFQVKQVHAKDRGELFYPSSDRGKAYSFPSKAFYQNEITIALPAGQGQGGTGTFSTLLTGFRNGQVRSIILWLTDDAQTNPQTGAPFVKNYYNFALPRDIQLLYNGTVYYDAQGTSSIFWNLVSSETPSQVTSSALSIAGLNPGAVIAKVPGVVNWVEIPFSQVYEQLSGSHMYVAGKEIMNAVVNLQLTVPDATKNYTLHAMYAYNCVMMVAGGSVEYVF